MTKPLLDGNNAKAAVEELMMVGALETDLIREALRDLNDGDDDVSLARAVLSEMATLSGDKILTLSHMRHREMTEALTIGERAVRRAREAVSHILGKKGQGNNGNKAV